MRRGEKSGSDERMILGTKHFRRVLDKALRDHLGSWNREGWGARRACRDSGVQGNLDRTVGVCVCVCICVCVCV